MSKITMNIGFELRQYEFIHALAEKEKITFNEATRRVIDTTIQMSQMNKTEVVKVTITDKCDKRGCPAKGTHHTSLAQQDLRFCDDHIKDFDAATGFITKYKTMKRGA